jgi:hypothetical protein
MGWALAYIQPTMWDSSLPWGRSEGWSVDGDSWVGSEVAMVRRRTGERDPSSPMVVVSVFLPWGLVG